MLPFIILLTVPIASYPFVKNLKINRIRMDRVPLFFFFFLLTLLVALRHRTIGNDTENYIYFFETTVRTPWNQMQWGSLEIGFQFYMKVVSMISDDPQFFLAVSAVVVSALIYPTYRRLCDDPSLTIVVFSILSTFVMMFSGIRQMMAVGIGFLAYEFTRRHKIIFFVIAVVLATMFHTSAFMLIFMYPVYRLHLMKKWSFIIVPVLAVVLALNRPIFSVIGPWLGEVTRFDFVARATGAYAMIVLFTVFSVFSFVIPDEDLMDEEMIGLRNFLLLSLVIQFFVPLNFLAMRMNYYYIIFIPLLLPKIIECRSKRWNQFGVTGRYVMLIFFFLYFFYNAYTSLTNLHVFPYHFLWETMAI